MGADFERLIFEFALSASPNVKSEVSTGTPRGQGGPDGGAALRVRNAP